MASYNRYVNNSTTQLNTDNKGFFNKILRNMSNWGMAIDDMSIKNSYATGIHETPTNLSSNNNGTNMYDIFTKKVISKVLDTKSIAFLDRAYEDKRKILRQYSIKDEIKDFVTQIADECVIYDDDNYFCKLKDLPDEFDNTIKQRYQENFKKLYHAFGFDDGITAWNFLKNFLIDGYIAYEIIYDDKCKNIIGLYPLDPMTLIVATDPGTSTVVWIQFPDNPMQRKILLDSQIIYISYSNNNEFSETSYVENLIRPYNQLKLIEQTRILYNINQAAIYKKFTIPVNGLTRQQAEQQIYQLMSEYHEDVQWDDTMGTVSINGSTNIPHSKDFWFPQSEGGSPGFEIVASQGTNLNEDSMLQWFMKNLKRASKLPFSRFDDDSGGGTFIADAATETRQEIKFNNFIKRLRTVFKEILIKPTKIQMTLDFPELKDDNLFHSSLKLDFNANELFEEWKYLNNLRARSEIAANLNSNLHDADDKPYLHVEWIVRKIMKLTDADINENNKYKMMGTQGSAQGGAQAGGGGEGGVGGGGMPEGLGGGAAQGGGAQGGPQAQGGGGAQGGPQAQGGGAQQTTEF